MISFMIDACEKRDLAVADIGGAYLHAFMDYFIILRMEGDSVEILCSVHEKYKQFVILSNGKKAIYLCLNKALYGCVKSALLWYKLFTKTLKGMGFKLNPYDPCVANKTINGKQCMILWYTNNMKVSHQDPNIVTMTLEK